MKQNFILILLATICLQLQSQIVIKVIDGDTYKVLLNGKLQTIRLANVDAPELDQSFGIAVRDSVVSLIKGSTLSLEAITRDLFGRLIVAAKYKGVSLDSLLIAKGLAWFYISYSHKLELKNYEAAAKLKGLGIWQCVQPVPP